LNRIGLVSGGSLPPAFLPEGAAETVLKVIAGRGANAVDELVARDYIVLEKPDIIVDILDAASLERNLYLTLLLLEIDSNLAIALNRWDMAEARGIKIDPKKLSRLLGCPVVPTVAVSGK
jgi:ferrous iron transport protein B